MEYKGIPLKRFASYLFDNPLEARQAAEVLAAILRARSARLTEIAAHMRGSFAAAYKRLQRFLQRTDPRLVLWRLLPDDTPLLREGESLHRDLETSTLNRENPKHAC